MERSGSLLFDRLDFLRQLLSDLFGAGVSGSQNESHFGRAIRAILRAVNRSFGSSLSLSPYPWRARGIASKVISYTCRSIGSG